MKEKIQLYEVDESWTPQYPVALEISTTEVEARVGGVRGKIGKAILLIREGDQIQHRLALTQDKISTMISALRAAQQRMEPVSTRVSLDVKERFVSKAEQLGKTPAEYLREMIEEEVS